MATYSNSWIIYFTCILDMDISSQLMWPFSDRYIKAEDTISLALSQFLCILGSLIIICERLYRTRRGIQWFVWFCILIRNRQFWCWGNNIARNSPKLFDCDSDSFNKPISNCSCVSAGVWFEVVIFRVSNVCIVDFFWLAETRYPSNLETVPWGIDIDAVWAPLSTGLHGDVYFYPPLPESKTLTCYTTLENNARITYHQHDLNVKDACNYNQ